MSKRERSGFSLIEILLSMTILLGAIAVLGELARQGRGNAQATVKETQAVLVAESKMAELITSAAAREPVERAKVVDSPGWLYTLEVESTTVEGLESLRLTVMEDVDGEKRPTTVELVRWVTASDQSQAAPHEKIDRATDEPVRSRANTAFGT